MIKIFAALSVLDLGRFQFAMTTIFHFFFVPLSIGLALTVAVMETIYVKTGNEKYKQMTRFFGRLFVLSFSVGVVTGIIQEFQFGMNWSPYSRFNGDVFGAPLAVEALVAFFMESTFLGLWMFGWNRFSKKVHCLFMWLVAFGSSLSALWILIANSFMQNPVGIVLQNGRAELVDFGALILNKQVWLEYGHVMFAAIALAGFFVAGTAASQMRKNRSTQFFRKAMRIGLVFAFIGSLFTLWVGDMQTQYIVKHQPMKFAAVEGLYETTGEKAPLSLMAIIDTENKTREPIIEIPGMLSILAYHKPQGAITGMNDLQKEFIERYGNDDYYPPVKTIYWSFRIMAFFGFGFLFLSIWGLIATRRKRMPGRLIMWLLTLCTVMPFVASTTGWLVTELGRAPWTVYGLFTIADSISPNVTANALLLTNIGYFIVFSALAIVMLVMMKRVFKKGPEDVLASEAEIALDPFAREVNV